MNLEKDFPYLTGPVLKEFNIFLELVVSPLLKLVDVFRAAEVELVLGWLLSIRLEFALLA